MLGQHECALLGHHMSVCMLCCCTAHGLSSQLRATPSNRHALRWLPPPTTYTVKLLFYLFPGDDDGGGSRSGNDRKWRDALRSLWRLIPRAMLVKVLLFFS